MNIHKQHYRYRQSNDSGIVVIPSTADYIDQMVRLHQVGYDYDASDIGACDECLTADKFANHLTVFPAGQFIAVDTATRQVVGLTVSMRANFDPKNPYLGSWGQTTDWG